MNKLILIFIIFFICCEKQSKDDFKVEFDNNQLNCLVLNKKEGEYLIKEFDGSNFKVNGCILTFVDNSSNKRNDTISKGGEIIPSIVLEYKSDKKYAIVLQKPISNFITIYNIKSKTHREIERLIEKSNYYCYWIILKNNNIVYGPLNLFDYKILKTKLKVPNNLKLMVEHN